MNNKTHAFVRVAVSKDPMYSTSSDHINSRPRNIHQDISEPESNGWYVIETYTSEEEIPEDFEENHEER